jgi:hypothetical protein
LTGCAESAASLAHGFCHFYPSVSERRTLVLSLLTGSSSASAVEVEEEGHHLLLRTVVAAVCSEKWLLDELMSADSQVVGSVLSTCLLLAGRFMEVRLLLQKVHAILLGYTPDDPPAMCHASLSASGGPNSWAVQQTGEGCWGVALAEAEFRRYTGTHRWSVEVLSVDWQGHIIAGVGVPSRTALDDFLGSDAFGWGLMACHGQLYHEGRRRESTCPRLRASRGTVVNVELNSDSDTLSFTIPGESGGGVAFQGLFASLGEEVGDGQERCLSPALCMLHRGDSLAITSMSSIPSICPRPPPPPPAPSNSGREAEGDGMSRQLQLLVPHVLEVLHSAVGALRSGNHNHHSLSLLRPLMAGLSERRLEHAAAGPISEGVDSFLEVVGVALEGGVCGAPSLTRVQVMAACLGGAALAERVSCLPDTPPSSMKWLGTPLFALGRWEQEGSPTMTHPSLVAQSAFLKELIEGEPASPACALAVWVTKHVGENAILRRMGGSQLARSIRAAMACTLWHTGRAASASALSRELLAGEPPSGTHPPTYLLETWRKAASLRAWAKTLRDSGIPYEDTSRRLESRAMFLLSLMPAAAAVGSAQAQGTDLSALVASFLKAEEVDSENPVLGCLQGMAAAEKQAEDRARAFILLERCLCRRSLPARAKCALLHRLPAALRGQLSSGAPRFCRPPGGTEVGRQVGSSRVSYARRQESIMGRKNPVSLIVGREAAFSVPASRPAPPPATRHFMDGLDGCSTKARLRVRLSFETLYAALVTELEDEGEEGSATRP